MHKASRLFLTVLAALFTCLSAFSQDLPVADFNKEANQPGKQILDVRTDQEFKSGHLTNALWADWTKQDDFMYRIQGLDKSKPVYTYCLSGGRSAAAAKLLREKGFTVYNMQGGIAAWKQAGMPLEAAAVVKQISMQEYQKIVSGGKTVLVDVGATWCPPCKKMNPIVDSLAAANPNFNLVKVDGGDQVELSKQLRIEALPTFIVYNNGKEVWRKTGLVDAAELAKQLK